MKQLLLLFCTVVALGQRVQAGPETLTSKDSPISPCPNWYADREWNLSIWGAYAFTSHDYPTLENANPFTSSANYDTYLEADHAWGVGVDAKYFFTRYLGIGIEAYGLHVRQSFPDVFIDFFNVGGTGNYARTSHDERAIGSVLGTFTLRYPIGCSRFAPYLFAGGGAIFGGGQVTRFDTVSIGDVVFTSRSESETKFIGQFGGGLEVRLTPHIGWINDFSWNIVAGSDNDFGMARTGINFAF